MSQNNAKIRGNMSVILITHELDFAVVLHIYSRVADRFCCSLPSLSYHRGTDSYTEEICTEKMLALSLAMAFVSTAVAPFILGAWMWIRGRKKDGSKKRPRETGYRDTRHKDTITRERETGYKDTITRPTYRMPKRRFSNLSIIYEE